jgi:hypothetical protein
MRALWARRLGIVLGAVFVVLGVVETVNHASGDWPFWLGSLVGGGLLVLAGSVRHWDNPFVPLVLVAAGALLGANATLPTVVLPVFALVVLTLVVLDAGDRVERRR